MLPAIPGRGDIPAFIYPSRSTVNKNLTHLSKLNKCISERICCRKFALPGKVDRSSAKSLKTGYAPMTLIHRARPNDLQEKRYNFYTLQYLGVPGHHHGPKFTNLGRDAQQGPDYQRAKFCFFNMTKTCPCSPMVKSLGRHVQ